MSAGLLQVRLEGTNQHPSQFILRFDASQYPVTLKVNNFTFNDWLRRVHPVLAGGKDPGGDIDPQDDLLRNVGVWLWQALLPESAPLQERVALAHALRTGYTPLLLELPDALAELPWELLYDPEQSDEKGFLARRRPLVRLSPNAAQVALIEPPLRVLLLISSPPVLGENSRVDVESERAAVEQATLEMRKAGFLHLVVEDIVTPKRVERLLDGFKPHIVHYIGHGEYDQTNGGVLLWEDDQGNVLQIEASYFASLLRSRNLHAVVLHGCETARSTIQAEGHGLAETLAQEGFPSILAMQANLTYESSQIASRVWYQALVSGQSMAEAVLAVRQALTKADRPDWAVPILQGSMVSLTPVLDATSIPGSPDPLLMRQGAASDVTPPAEAFVGRHRELRALHLMLEDPPESSPVTALITGPGGMGKSTLVAQAVTRYGGSYKATLMLRCQEYQRMDLFLRSIGEFLKRLGASFFLDHTLSDPKLSTEAKIDEAIVALNTTGPVLLIIDSLESVQDEDQTISDKDLLYLLQKLLNSLRSGKVLITSRSIVRELLSQDLYQTRFLHLDLEDLSSYETSQLLLRYPSLARLSDIVQQMLIQEFGGLPYVYHLLSSKAAVEDLEQIIYEVREYGEVKQKMITKERRQQTTEEWQKVHNSVVEFATLEVIMSQLSEASRTLLVQLEVLHQPFPLAAIEEGLGTGQLVWQPLLDWSLLHYDPQVMRYRLHSLTKRSLQNLSNEQNRAQAQAQLASWYEHYAYQKSNLLEDYLEAHRLFRGAGDGQRAGELVIRLVKFLVRYGYYSLLYELCMTTLKDIGRSEGWLTAAILHTLGLLADARGEYEEARQLCQQSLDMKERLGDQRGRATSLNQLGRIAQHQGMYEEARQFYQQSIQISEQLGDQELRATSLNQLGLIALRQGEYEEAKRLYRQNLEVADQMDIQELRAASFHQLGIIAQKQGEYEEARQFYQQSLEIDERLGSQSAKAATFHKLGELAQDQGEYEEARQFYQQSLEISEQLGDWDARVGSLHNLAVIAQEQGELEEARRFYQQSLEISERPGDQGARAISLYSLATIAHRQREYEKARRLYQESLQIHERLGHQSERATTLSQLGIVALDQGEYEEARQLYQQSLEISERLGDQKGMAISLHNLGRVAQDQGELEEARQLCKQSLQISERLGDLRGRAVTLNQLGLIVQDQGEYEEARQLYQQSLQISEQLDDQSTRANALHNLGRIAQNQGEYEEARQLYQQSLQINEQLGDLREQMISFYQLGRIVYEQGDFEKASIYTIQAYVTFDFLQSPLRDAALRMIVLIRSQIDEETFMTQWRTLAGSLPLPILTAEDRQQQLRQVVRAFLVAPTWSEGKRLLEAHPELLQPEVDMLLQELTTKPAQGNSHQIIANRRLLLALCRERGIDAAFAQIQKESTMALEELPSVVSSIILQGTTEQCQQFATDLVEAQQQLPPEAIPLGLFLGCLVAALHGETPEVAQLAPPFTELWQEFQERLRVPPDQSSQQIE